MTTEKKQLQFDLSLSGADQRRDHLSPAQEEYIRDVVRLFVTLGAFVSISLLPIMALALTWP